MKKFTVLSLILLCLCFNINTVTPKAVTNIFKEGFYRVSDYNFSPTYIYNVKNISPDSGVYVIIFNENEAIQQSIRLTPNSLEYNLPLLKPDYSIVVIGKGEASIS